jgi:hypothetical protein
MPVKTRPVVTPGMSLQAAETASLAERNQLDSVELRAVSAGRIPPVNVADRLLSARALLTIDGASTLDLGISDPEWLIEASGLLDLDGNGRLNAIDVTLDTLAFRLVKASRQDPTILAVTFEDKAVALLRDHTKPRTWSRGSITRAQAIEAMVREVRETYIPFYAPEKGHKQPVDRPDYPKVTPNLGQSGFDKGTRFKIKQATADAEQMRNVATVLGVCDQLSVTPRARLAILVAGIGENDFHTEGKPSSAGARGVFQLIPETERNLGFSYRDVEAGARHFLQHGFYKYGGAIKLAHDHPGMTVGEIASRVEGSATDGQNAYYYNSFHDEAVKIAALWHSGDQNQGSHESLHIKAYQFTRGLPGKREDSFQAAQRLAQDVAWRFYVVGGIAVFATDAWLITNPAEHVLDDPDGPGLLERPAYDWDHGKHVGIINLRVIADRWTVLPGEVVALDGQAWGPLQGRWLVETVDQNLLDRTDCALTLIAPVAARLEPAPEVISRTTTGDGTTGGDTATSGAGADAALKWARSKIGHFKEEFANNRGSELDKLEGQFHMQGQPWCAIFATEAVAQGAGDQVKTASVAQIRAWAQAGTHGYERGFRGTPQPGDLMCFGTEHVALVEKVHGDQVGTIEGNTSANQVARLTRTTNSGVFVRPAYRT